MSKGLEALPYFKTLFDIWKEKIPVDDDTKEIEEEYEFKPRYELIEKELKALELIKNKPWLVSEIVESKGDYKVYKSWCSVFRADMKNRATEQEYDLLKEVLL